MTTAERSQKFKAGQRAKGLVQVNVWLPAAAAAEFRQAAEAIAANPGELRIGRLVNVRTGRVERLAQ
jgi:hypothetical protein